MGKYARLRHPRGPGHPWRRGQRPMAAAGQASGHSAAGAAQAQHLPAIAGAGLRNSKAQNLCYLNASLQALFHCHELRSRLESLEEFVSYTRTPDPDDFADKAAAVAAQRGISAREPNLLPQLLRTMADMCDPDSDSANVDAVLGELFRQDPATFAVGESCSGRRRRRGRIPSCARNDSHSQPRLRAWLRRPDWRPQGGNLGDPGPSDRDGRGGCRPAAQPAGQGNCRGR